MPLYEYYCQDCRTKFELLTIYTASEVDVECAKCHGTHVRKLFSVFAAPRKSSGVSSDDFGADFSSDLSSEYGEGEGDDFDDDGEYAGGGSCACGGGGCGCHD
jgi:putative FmdB family regulatory protein